MTLDQAPSDPSEPTQIARSRLAAAQWEALLADGPGLADRSAWHRQRLLSLDDWLALRWEQARIAGSAAHDRCLLAPGQSARLWRRVIDESAEGALLIGSAGVAVWAERGRRHFLEQGIAPSESLWQGASQETAFLRWHRDFERRLNEHGWIDGDSLLFELNRRPDPDAASGLTLLDPRPAPCAELDRLLASRRAAGAAVAVEWPAPCRAERRMLIAASPEDELMRASAWTARQLERFPGQRIAVVVPDLDARAEEVERAFADRLGPDAVGSACGRPAGRVAALAAVIAALRLLSPRGDFSAMSRWLRSPFFGDSGSGSGTGPGPNGDPDRARHAAALERQLRSDPRAQAPFIVAYREFGLRAEMARRLPQTVARFDELLSTQPRRATPTAWSSYWQKALRSLGWIGSLPGDASIDPWRAAWERTLASFAALTPITGALDAGAAIDELERALARQTLSAPMPQEGVHLLERIGDVGPGFAGTWIMGFSDRLWPEPALPNPLIPWRVQQRHGLPGAEPAAGLAAAKLELERLLARVPQAVLSCPARVLDQPQVPNPRFDDWHTLTLADSPRFEAASGFAASRIGARERESIADTAPPFTADRIPGGARTLDLQSACPAVAFASIRLRAEPLEPAVRGIDTRLRGMLTHRVLEILYRDRIVAGEHPSAGGNRPDGTDPESAIATALAELFPSGDAAWQAQVAAERQRLAALVAALETLEGQRAAFSTIAVEQRASIELRGHRLSCRIDRRDRLAAGGELLLDYKTGKQAGTAWFDDRLGDCQLPLYAILDEAATTAIALVLLNENGVSFRAAGPAAKSFPGRQTEIADDDWLRQLRRWRAQIEGLVAEFVDGDVRIRRDIRDLADGAWAALCRAGNLPE